MIDRVMAVAARGRNQTVERRARARSVSGDDSEIMSMKRVEWLMKVVVMSIASSDCRGRGSWS